MTHPCPAVLLPKVTCSAPSRRTDSSGSLAFPTLPVGSARPGHAVLHPPPLDRKSPPVTEVKATAGKVGKEDRRGAAQEKKQLGIREKEDRKPAKLPGKEACWDIVWASGGAGEASEGLWQVDGHSSARPWASQ